MVKYSSPLQFKPILSIVTCITYFLAFLTPLFLTICHRRILYHNWDLKNQITMKMVYSTMKLPVGRSHSQH